MDKRSEKGNYSELETSLLTLEIAATQTFTQYSWQC